MRIVRFDSVGGASGDVILGALIELGVDPAELERELQSLDAGHFHIVAKPFASHGLHGTQVAVETDHHCGHAHHHHDRHLPEIEQCIRKSALPDAVKEQSLAVFRRMGEVEAGIHGTTVDKIHFHEVGAVDSIVDIVGCCLALHRLQVDAVSVGPLPQGQGTVTCAHGVYPNPAPATAELLRGMEVKQTDEPFELVTPTGAALLSMWGKAGPDAGPVRVLKSGYGFGHHKLNSRPNVLRASLLERVDSVSSPDVCLVLECNIDDSTPEIMGSLVETLLLAGALDVFTSSVQMKKQRPGVLLTVLCAPSERDRFLDVIFRESSTFGVREYTANRTVLDRRWVPVETPYGQVRIKIGRWRDEDVTLAPEMEDCMRCAQQHGVPVRLVYEKASSAAQPLRGTCTSGHY
ncbi:MAG: nickel pincer cofactor biosynthesis protein LarC [bacterium]